MHQQPDRSRSGAATFPPRAAPPRGPTKRRNGRHYRRRSRSRSFGRVLVGIIVVCAVGLLVGWGVGRIFGSDDTAEPDLSVAASGVTTTTRPPVALGRTTLVKLRRTLVALGPAGMPQGAAHTKWRERPTPALDAAGTIPRSSAPLPPDLTSERWVVIDADSGAVLAGHNEHQQAAMASTIKVLTALTVLRLTDPEDAVTIDGEADDVGERGLWLAAGEQHTVHDLLGGMLVGSANDAATALAKHVGGTIPRWAAIANFLAKQYGAKDTNVVNPHGLDADGHVSSAYDLAVLARVGLADPVFADWVKTERFEVPWPGNEWPRVAWNKNKLLKQYPGALGVKTGGTNQAGSTLISAAEREGERYIVVVMKSWNASAESMALLDWAFAGHDRVELAEKGETIETDSGDEVETEAALAATVPVELEKQIRTYVEGSEIRATLDGEVLGVAGARL